MGDTMYFGTGPLPDRDVNRKIDSAPADIKGRPLVVATTGVPDSTGAPINPDSYAITAVTRDASGNLLTTTITDGTSVWVQTITRDANGDLATMSVWVKQ